MLSTKNTVFSIATLVCLCGCSVQEPAPKETVAKSQLGEQRSSQGEETPDVQGRLQDEVKQDTQGSPMLSVDAPPTDIIYSVVKFDILPRIKRSLDVRLNKKVSKDALRSIALELKAQDPRSYERTFICYYLSDMAVGHGAWATTQFDPDLDVQILGLTLEQEQILKEKLEPSRGVVGRWLNEMPFIGGTMTILRENGKVFLENAYKDGSKGRRELVETVSGEGRTFRKKEGSSAGDFYLINSQGHLEVWDQDGLIFTARKLN